MQQTHLILSFLSLILFIFGFTRLALLKKERPLSLITGIVASCYLLYSVCYLVAYYFTGNGIDYSVLYHMKFGLNGAGIAEYKELLVFVFISIILGVSIISYLLLKGNRRTKSLAAVVWCFGILSVSVSVHPASYDLFKLSKVEEGESFWKYYRSPRIIKSPAETMNVVFIYAESLERSYFDDNIFPDLINGLREVESEAISFTNIGNFPNTGWTIAGMVASQCGIPLVALSHGNSMAGMDTFLEGATCMGDLLRSESYQLSFMGGASLDFAGKGSFFRTHGFRNVMGREELEPLLLDKSYVTGWGLYDDSLFDLAFHEYESLVNKGEQFGLFLINLDTHGADHYSKSCKGQTKGGDRWGNIACTDMLLTSFIRKIQNTPGSEKTVIVVASDHLRMRGSARLHKANRKNLFFILDPRDKNGRKVEAKGSTLDIGPTVLSALGYEARLGLGRNLLKGYPAIIDEVHDISRSVTGWRDELLSFWAFPRVKNKIMINGNKDTVLIDDREFKVPILVQYDRNLQTQIRFEIYNDPLHKSLTEHLSEFKGQDAFLLVDNCRKISKWLNQDYHRGLCYVNGSLGDETLKVERAKGNITLTSSTLKNSFRQVINDTIFQQRLARLTRKQ